MAKNMRRVKYSKYVSSDVDGNPVNGVLSGFAGLFHAFGCDVDNEGGTFSTAIIETKDGALENIPVTDVVFLDKLQED